ncbi:MAG TPA: serine protease [Anaerolineales bacterium]|nr:serine protease [Anaerolineales bacterium]
MKPKLDSRVLIVTVFALAGLLAACGGAQVQPTLAATVPPAPTSTPTQSPFANPAVPFEAVVQIWAAYYDEVDELQIGWTGSGTIISPDGLILTNAHVVLPDRYFPVDELIVAMTVSQDQPPEPTYFAEVLQADATLDLAVIRVTHDYDGNEVSSSLVLPYALLGDSDQLNLGDRLTILGYPGIGGDTVTLTSGEVSGFTSQPDYGTRAFVKTSATIAGGNSGGMAVDANGQLVGVPTQLGYGGDDQYVDCRVLVDTNRDGFVDELDSCVPTGGFINALRPVALALPLIEAAQRGEVSIIGAEEPVAAVEPVESGSVTDDFSNEVSGWDVYSYESGSAYYFNGEYYLEDIAGDPYYQARSYLNLDNVEMSIDVRVDQSEGVNEIDFICRYVDESNNYEFRLAEDGTVGISKWLDGEYINLVDLQPGSAPLGSGVHRVDVVCDGNDLSLSVDGVLVAETFDDSFVSGDVGLAVFTADNYFVAAFDNFEAVALGGQQAAGDVVIFDDFSDPASGWVEDSDPDWDLYYGGGSYFFEIGPSQFYLNSYLVEDHTNIVVNVDVNIEQPAFDGDIGVLCRYIDSDNYYALEVSEDGYYSIWKRVAGEVVYLVEWTSSDLVPIDSSPFVLNASCDGAQLMVGINGEVLAQATDTDFATGYAGLTAGTWENGGLIVSFDNFEVIEY